MSSWTFRAGGGGGGRLYPLFGSDGIFWGVGVRVLMLFKFICLLVFIYFCIYLFIYLFIIIYLFI